MATKLSNPLIHLTDMARKLSRGDFSVSTRIRTRSQQDEIGILSRTFQQMSLDLKNSYEQLEDYSRTLENKVEERTEALNRSLAEVETFNKKIMAISVLYI